MIDPPKIVCTAAQPATILRLAVPRREIQPAMGAGCQDLLAGLFDFCVFAPLSGPQRRADTYPRP